MARIAVYVPTLRERLQTMLPWRCQVVATQLSLLAARMRKLPKHMSLKSLEQTTTTSPTSKLAMLHRPTLR